MSRNWEQVFSFWAGPPSASEQERCDRVISAIRQAVLSSPKLSSRKVRVFTQGSYRNRVNVRQESDVDVGVMLYEYFLSQYPAGKSHSSYGNFDAGYSFSQFKDELEESLVEYFGRDAVVRGNKAFDIKASSVSVEADVVPLFEFRHYWENGSYRAGVALIPDNASRRIENYPERLIDYWPETPLHYENGVSKNEATTKRFKGMVRILKKLRVDLQENENEHALAIPGYLLECLAWNTPNWCYAGESWELRVQSVLRFLWQNTREDKECASWCEVDGIKYLFHISQPWTRAQAHSFMNAAWDLVGVKS